MTTQTKGAPQALPPEEIEKLRGLLERAFPHREPELYARHFGESTEITGKYTSDTLARVEDGYENFEAFADLIVSTVNALPSLLSEIERLREENERAKVEVRSLIESIWCAEFRQAAPNWKPLPDLCGMISQLDNMYAGVREQRDEARDLAARRLTEGQG